MLSYLAPQTMVSGQCGYQSRDLEVVAEDMNWNISQVTGHFGLLSVFVFVP
jgi:hypothetical protein